MADWLLLFFLVNKFRTTRESNGFTEILPDKEETMLMVWHKQPYVMPHYPNFVVNT